MSDKYEATFHPECQIAPLRGQNEPQSDVQPVRELPDATDAGEALVQQIAEAIRSVVIPSNEQLRDLVEAVLPLVEAQVAPLRDALTRVRALADAFADDDVPRYGGNIAWHVEEAIANEKGDFPDAADRHIASQRERAIAAESALRQVSELADEWEDATIWDGSPAIVDRAFGSRLRAVLDSARVGAADTQPEEAGA